MKRSALVLALVLAASGCFAQEAPNPFTARNTRPRATSSRRSPPVSRRSCSASWPLSRRCSTTAWPA